MSNSTEPVSPEIPMPSFITTNSLSMLENSFSFGYLGTFLSYITPHDLPVGEWCLKSVKKLNFLKQ